MKHVPNKPVLQVRDLEISFPFQQSRFKAVDRISFDLQAGEVLGLLGESGCGKSVTGAALLGLVPKPEGQVNCRRLQLGEQELHRLREKDWRKIRGDSISMVFQNPLTSLDPVFSVGQQLCEVIRRHRQTSNAETQNEAIGMLRASGFVDPIRIMQAYPHQLSGGMQQRVVIAMAMSCRPRVLIADEPTTALDVTTQAEILGLIRSLARDTGTAVLLITHDLSVVASSCDRAMVMYCGRIVEQGPAQTLLREARHPYTAGLMAAVPRLSAGSLVPVEEIPGSVPGIHEISNGCRFSNRCHRSDQQCLQISPVLQHDPAMLDSGMVRQFACHHPLVGTQGRDS